MNALQLFDVEAARGGKIILGIDEAGRGPLAGPVVAAAVRVSEAEFPFFEDVDDSKKLTEAKREKIFARILERKISYGAGFASSAEIDRYNILQATFLAMRRAGRRFFDLNNAHALVDGNHAVKNLPLPQSAVIGGDAKSFSIAMASVIAKVYRDRYMKIIDGLYPAYGFGGHKGYGCQKHIEAIEKHGPCREHRRTFAPLKNMELFL